MTDFTRDDSLDRRDIVGSHYSCDAVMAMDLDSGNAYLRRAFPRLDYVKKATIVKPPAPVKPESWTPEAES